MPVGEVLEARRSRTAIRFRAVQVVRPGPPARPPDIASQLPSIHRAQPGAYAARPPPGCGRSAAPLRRSARPRCARTHARLAPAGRLDRQRLPHFSDQLLVDLIHADDRTDGGRRDGQDLQNVLRATNAALPRGRDPPILLPICSWFFLASAAPITDTRKTLHHSRRVRRFWKRTGQGDQASLEHVVEDHFCTRRALQGELQTLLHKPPLKCSIVRDRVPSASAAPGPRSIPALPATCGRTTTERRNLLAVLEVADEAFNSSTVSVNDSVVP